MTMRTLGELEDSLAQELSWRRAELHGLLTSIRSTRGPSGESFRRGGLALLYAHWEGYTKAALGYYWDYIARRRLRYRELGLNFVALGIERELRRIQGAHEFERMLRRVHRILSCDDDRALMSEREIITEGNLSSERFEHLMIKLGLDVKPFQTKYKLIDYSLLATRNKVAHGEFMGITVKDYEALHSEVMGLMEMVRNAISNAANAQLYLRSADSMSHTGDV